MLGKVCGNLTESGGAGGAHVPQPPEQGASHARDEALLLRVVTKFVCRDGANSSLPKPTWRGLAAVFVI